MTALVNQEKSLRPLVIASRKGSRLKRPNARSCAGGVAGPSTAQLVSAEVPSTTLRVRMTEFG